MRDVVRASLISFSVLLLASPAAYGSTGFAFLAATIQIALAVLILVVTWDRVPAAKPTHVGIPGRVIAALAATTGGILLFAASRAWLSQIVRYPIDVRRSEGLTLVEYGVRRMLHGQNPYTTYYLPGKTTLSYGPLLWGPYMAPYLLHADLRFAALIGELFVPAACAICCVALAAEGLIVPAAAWMGALAVFALSTPLFDFAAVAHTPVYWPLVGLLAWLVSRERWSAAAAVTGLLVVARTTMVTIAPILLIAVWRANRVRLGERRAGAVSPLVSNAILMALCALIPLVPFAVWDWPALRCALYGACQGDVTGLVPPAAAARDAIGLTGLLLRMGWGRIVEPAHIAALGGVYLAAWFAIGRGRRPSPWMVLALFTFAATTLRPVVDLYFDVLVLAVCAALAETPWIQKRSVAPGLGVLTVWIAVFVTAGIAVAVVARLDIPRDPTIDIGISASRPLLYSGFADDEAAGRTFTWVDGQRAEILVPRRSRQDAEIELVCQPNLPTPASTQEMSVALNGVVLGTVALHEGWQTVTLPAPSRAWQIGVNELTMAFTNAISPLESGLSKDARKLSVAFDRLAVRTR